MSVGKTRPHTRRINCRHGLQDLRSSTQCFDARLGRLQYCQVVYAQPPCACLPQSPRRSAQVAAAPYFVLTPLASVAMDSHWTKSTAMHFARFGETWSHCCHNRSGFCRGMLDMQANWSTAAFALGNSRNQSSLAWLFSLHLCLHSAQAH